MLEIRITRRNIRIGTRQVDGRGIVIVIEQRDQSRKRLFGQLVRLVTRSAYLARRVATGQFPVGQRRDLTRVDIGKRALRIIAASSDNCGDSPAMTSFLDGTAPVL